MIAALAAITLTYGYNVQRNREGHAQLHAVLLGVMALLQREQRVTYRTLRYVFGVDEACLYAVRDELHFRQLAREEGGQGLLWTGEHSAQGATAPPLAPAPALALPAVPPRSSLRKNSSTKRSAA